MKLPLNSLLHQLSITRTLTSRRLITADQSHRAGEEKLNAAPRLPSKKTSKKKTNFRRLCQPSRFLQVWRASARTTRLAASGCPGPSWGESWCTIRTDSQSISRPTQAPLLSRSCRHVATDNKGRLKFFWREFFFGGFAKH